MKDTNLAESIRTILQTHTHRSYTPVAHSVSSPNDRHAYWPTCAMRSTKAESTIAGRCTSERPCPVNGLFSILGKISLNTDTNSIHPHHTFTSSLPHNKIIRWHGQNVEQKVKFSHLNDHISHQNYHNCYFLTSQLRNKGSKKVNFSSFSRCSWILETCRHVKLALSRANAGRHFFPEVNVTIEKIQKNMKNKKNDRKISIPSERPVRAMAMGFCILKRSRAICSCVRSPRGIA